MSTQLDTRDEVVTGLAFIEGIDLDLEPACEHSQHETRHPTDAPAEYVVRYDCTECRATKTYLICKPGWVGMSRTVICGFCRTDHLPKSSVLRIVSVL